MKSLSWAVVCLFFTLGAQAADAPKKTPELVEKGKVSFTTNCVTCHGAKGDGMGDAGKYMNPHPRDFNKEKFKNGETPAAVFKSITKGLDGTSMAGFPQLSEDERWALTYYVLTFKGK